MQRITIIASETGIQKLIVDVLPETHAILKMLEASGPKNGIASEEDAIHIKFQLS